MRFPDTGLFWFCGFFPLTDSSIVAINMPLNREAEGTVADSNTQHFLFYCDPALSTAVIPYLTAAAYLNRVVCSSFLLNVYSS